MVDIGDRQRQGFGDFATVGPRIGEDTLAIERRAIEVTDVQRVETDRLGDVADLAQREGRERPRRDR